MKIKIPNKSIYYLSLVFLLLLLARLYGEHGIDIYQSYAGVLSDGVGSWGTYYRKEFISWGVLHVISFINFKFGIKLFILDISLYFLISSWYCRSEKFNYYNIGVFVFSLMFVLLAFNVLRQYLSVIMAFVAIAQALERRTFRLLLFSLISVFSHNYIAPIVGLLCFSFLNKYCRIIILLIFVSAIWYFISNDLRIEDYISANPHYFANTKTQLLAYMILSLWIFFVWIIYSPYNIAINKLTLFFFLSFISGALLTVTNFPVWAVERYWLTTVSLQFLVVSLFQFPTISSVRRLLLRVTYLICFLSVFIHPGAFRMIFN